MLDSQLLTIRNLTYKLPNTSTNLFTIPHLEIKKGEKILIKGLSGKGKTTLLHIMAGFIQSYEGEVHLLGNNMATITETDLSLIRKTKSSFIFQKLNLITTLTPLENLELVARGSFDKTEALFILKDLGMDQHANTISAKLSTGEQQRVACARAIFSRPEILFADEPTSSLDDLNTQKVMELLLQKIPSITLIAVSHDHRLEKYFHNTIQFEDMQKQ